MVKQIDVIQIYPGTDEIRTEVLECTQAWREWCSARGHSYQFLRPEIRGGDPVATSDTVRMELAVDHPQMLFACADTKPIGEFDFSKDDKSYFSFNRHHPTHPAIDMFYVNGCCEYFQFVWAEKLRRGIKDVLGWPTKIIYRHEKYVHQIPFECYEHLHLRCKDAECRRAKQIPTQEGESHGYCI